LAVYKGGNKPPIVDMSQYLAEAEACEKDLINLIKKPLVDNEKPKPVE